MKYRPITIRNGCVRTTADPNAQFYVEIMKNGYQRYVPRKDTDTYIACFYNGYVTNIPFTYVVFDTIPKQSSTECECGKDKHGFAFHSSWCPKYKI